MIILKNAEDMRSWSSSQRNNGFAIGFVPTMGALHEGHASLMRSSIADNNASVLSIFVNPTQFAPHEDFELYPRTFDDDCAMAENLGIDVLYAPTASEMYPINYSTYVNVGGVSEGLCSASRPHFYRGVCTVVTKLFNAIMPHRAYFGQKDAQQTAVIRRMVRDLDMGIKIIEMPIIREVDGLAMSSRNKYLSVKNREKALAISKALDYASEMLTSGESDASTVISAVLGFLNNIKVDYVSLVDADTMHPVTKIEKSVVLAVAAYVGETRLIDNFKFDPKTLCEDSSVFPILEKCDK